MSLTHNDLRTMLARRARANRRDKYAALELAVAVLALAGWAFAILSHIGGCR